MGCPHDWSVNNRGPSSWAREKRVALHYGTADRTSFSPFVSSPGCCFLQPLPKPASGSIVSPLSTPHGKTRRFVTVHAELTLVNRRALVFCLPLPLPPPGASDSPSLGSPTLPPSRPSPPSSSSPSRGSSTTISPSSPSHCGRGVVAGHDKLRFSKLVRTDNRS